MSDDKATFLKRVADKEYPVHDLDHANVEMHGDVAITYVATSACLYLRIEIRLLLHASTRSGLNACTESGMGSGSFSPTGRFTDPTSLPQASIQPRSIPVAHDRACLRLVRSADVTDC